MQDTILVSFVDGTKSDNPILVVGRKRLNQSVEIINVFQGDEARELYERLVSVKNRD
jgi:hypothetical protein